MGLTEVGPVLRRWLPLDGQHGPVTLTTPINEVRVAERLSKS